MKCVICKKGETQPGKVTVTLDKKEGATSRLQRCSRAYLLELR